MFVDVQKYKVIYDDKVLKALALQDFLFRENELPGLSEKTRIKPKTMTVVCIDEDGNVVLINDETWRFQFIPNLAKEE